MNESPVGPIPDGGSPDLAHRSPLINRLYAFGRAARTPLAARRAALISMLTLGAQALALGAQVTFAVLFGATAQSDAFFAALAVPLYVTTVLIASLSVVFVPIVVEHHARGGPEGARDLATGTLQLTTITLSAITVGGMILAEPLIVWSAPGLDPPTRRLAAELALLIWPSVLASGLVALLASLCQVEGRFGWASAVPLVGAAANLALIAALAPSAGVFSAAMAWTVSAWLQVALLAPIATRFWRAAFVIRHPALLALVIGLAPLAAANLFIRASTVLERYLGSELPPGELSQLTYASRIVAAVTLFVAAGPGAVLFVRLAGDAATGDRARLASTISRGMQALWLIAAPLVAIMVGLAEPGIRILLEYGAFARPDSLAVAALVRIYAPTVLAGALSAITGHAIYALKATRTIAAIGALEGLAYVVYTPVLAQHYGASGIALGLTIYHVGSLTWQLAYLRRATRAPGARVARRLSITSSLALAAGVASWLVAGLLESPFGAFAVGGGVGLLVYALGVAGLQRSRIRILAW